MTQAPQIKRNPDGSIDTKYYMGKGLDARSRAALGLLARVIVAIGKGPATNATTTRATRSPLRNHYV